MGISIALQSAVREMKLIMEQAKEFSGLKQFVTSLPSLIKEVLLSPVYIK